MSCFRTKSWRLKYRIPQCIKTGVVESKVGSCVDALVFFFAAKGVSTVNKKISQWF